ncbi:MAG: cytochrome c family protein [Ahrensia sp.]|nr:cytochrome c family protein [Ahrensia sp.]
MGFEWNKIFGALLGAAFVVLGVNFLSDSIYSMHKPAQEGFALEGGEVEVAAVAPKEEVIEPVGLMLAKMEISEGEKVARKCVACHAFEQGGANKVGPALWGIVNRPIAGVDGFGYSGALTAYAADGKVWDYDELNGFLYRPKAWVSGTSMGFAGLKDVGERAAIIAYMRSLADTMAPLPEAENAAAGGDDTADTAVQDATVATPAPGSGEANTQAEGESTDSN